MSVRFAPSPTGAFHIGNFRTAWISHELARALQLPWVVRFEDIDGARVVAGAQQRQLEEMGLLGMKPDRLLVQSELHARHESLFRSAIERGQVYPCTCSRKELLEDLQRMASAPHAEAPIYNGRCRDPKLRAPRSNPTLAWRFRSAADPSGFQDFIVGRTDPSENGFVPSYHWACAIDDYDGDHSLLVRASDLAQVVAIQRRIFEWVGERERNTKAYPAVFHTALVTRDDGHRLEKRTQGVTLPELIQVGFSASVILERFKASFDPTHLASFAPGCVSGETPEKISLSRLLLTSGARPSRS